MILVTGATGNVGRNVVEGLLAAGESVRAMSRDPASAHLPAAVEVVRGDLRRPETLSGAIEGIERAFLFPVTGHLRPFLEAGRARGLRRVVLLSSSSASAPDLGALGRSHADNEHVVRSVGIPWTFARPGAFMANDLSWAPQIQNTGVVRAPYGNAATAPIDEKDIATVVVTALLRDGHEGRAYTLTGPESLTPIERVGILSEVLAQPLRFEELTPEEGRRQMQGRGTLPAVADSLLAMMASRVGVRASVSDEVMRVTGRGPSTYRQWATRRAGDLLGRTEASAARE